MILNKGYKKKLIYIASGNDADVYKLIKKNCIGINETFAVKMYKTRVSNQSILQDYLSLKKIRSKKCVLVQSVDKISGRISFIMEFIDGMTLNQLISQSNINENELKNIVSQCLQALLDLKSYGLSHGDLSCRNILIDNKGEVKLVDFGLGNLKDKKTTLAWGDPESLTNGIQDFKSDLYSLGKIIENICYINNLEFNRYEGLLLPRSTRNFDRIRPTNKCCLSLSKKVKACKNMVNERTALLDKTSATRKIFKFKASKIIINMYVFLGMALISQAKHVEESAYVSVVPEKWIQGLKVSGIKTKLPVSYLKVRAGTNMLEWYIEGQKKTKTLTIKGGEHIVIRDSFFER